MIRKLGIYVISQSESTGYDTYNSAVVAAYTAEDARKCHPNSIAQAGDWIHNSGDWASKPENVTAVRIGDANKQVCNMEVLCASFNAG